MPIPSTVSGYIQPLNKDSSSTNLNDTIFHAGHRQDRYGKFRAGGLDLTINNKIVGASGGRTWPEPGVYSYLDGQNPNVLKR